MEIYLDPRLSVTCHASHMLQAPQKIDHNSTIAQCADSAPESSGCCLSQLLDKIIEYFDTLLVCLGLKERKIDQLLKDPIGFLKLLRPDTVIEDDMVPSINSKNKHDETIFFLLCEHEGKKIDLPNGEKLMVNHEMIEYVLRKENPLLNHQNRTWFGRTELHVAQSLATAALILDQDPEFINVRDHQGNTPLHIAAANGKAEFVQFLIDRKTSVWVRGYYENTPLHFAKTVEIAQMLLAVDKDLLIAMNNPVVWFGGDSPQNPVELHGDNTEVGKFLRQQVQTFNIARSKVDLQKAITDAFHYSTIAKDDPKPEYIDQIKRYLDIAKARIVAGEDYRIFSDGEDLLTKAESFSDISEWRSFLDVFKKD